MKTGRSIFVQSALWIVFVVWGVVLWRLSATPSDSLHMPLIPYIDKVAHFGYFLAGGILLARPLHLSFGLTGKRLVIAVVIFMALVGIADETHQLFTPGRSGGDRGDWVADCSGAVVGAILMAWSYARKKS